MRGLSFDGVGFEGELLILSARDLLLLGRLDGVLWIPDGGVLTTGSGCSGVGGSSGSSCTTSGITPAGDRCSPLPTKGLRISSSSSGPGGGSGRGLGLIDERRGFAVNPPPTFRAGDFAKLALILLAGALKRLLDVPLASWLASIDPSPGSATSGSDSLSSCALSALSTSSPSPSGLPGLDALGSASCAEVEAAGCRLLNMSGLCRARLAFVGDAKDGRIDRLVLELGGESVGVVDLFASIATELVGDVLRRLGADNSIL